MNTGHNFNNAAAKAVEGLLWLAQKNRQSDFFTAMNILTGQNAGFSAAMTDIFDLYSQQSGKSSVQIVNGLQNLAVNTQRDEGIESIAAGFETISAENLRHALEFLEFSVKGGLEKQIKKARMGISGYSGNVESLSSKTISNEIGRDPSLGLIDQSRVFWMGIRKKPSEELSLGQKLKISLAAFVEDLCFQRFYAGAMPDDFMLHNFFSRIAYAAGGKLSVDYDPANPLTDFRKFAAKHELDEKRAYAIFEAVSNVGACRLPFFDSVPERAVDVFVDSISEGGRRKKDVRIDDKITNLEVYPWVAGKKIDRLTEIAIELLGGSDSAHVLRLEGDGLVKSIIPKIHGNYSFVLLPYIFLARNSASAINYFAVSNCRNVEGAVPSDEAKHFLSRYFSTISSFDDKKMLKLVRG